MPATQISNGLATVHNYTEEDLADIRTFFEAKCKYLVYGLEICPTTERPHVHFVFQLHRKTAIGVIHKMLKSKRVVDLKFPLRATDPAHQSFAPDYCKKGDQTHAEWEADGNRGLHHGDNYQGEEFGQFITNGHRTDLDDLRDAVNAAPNFKTLLHNTDVAPTLARNLNYAKELFNAKRPTTWEEYKGKPFEPLPWQAVAIDIIKEKADDRTIHWFYDPVGSSGKSTLSQYLVRNHGAMILAGKSADMFHAYDMEPIVIVDIPRADNMDYLNYGAIEKLKDGVFFSGKYNSGLKTRDTQAHVMVFSNNLPDETKWTKDRLNLIRLSEPPQDPWNGPSQFLTLG